MNIRKNQDGGSTTDYFQHHPHAEVFFNLAIGSYVFRRSQRTYLVLPPIQAEHNFTVLTSDKEVHLFPSLGDALVWILGGPT
jgi:hypothetical protein